MIAWHIQLLIAFSTINNVSLLVNNSNSTSVFLKQAFHTNPGADKKNRIKVIYFNTFVSKVFKYISKR